MQRILPIIEPFINLLRSRKFLVAVITLVLDIVFAYAPQLEGERETIMQLVTTVLGVLVIWGIAYEDAAAKSSGKR